MNTQDADSAATNETDSSSNVPDTHPKQNQMFVLMPRVPPPRNGTLLDLPGRKAYLPQIYQVQDHKLAPKGHHGRIFVAYMNYSEDAMGLLFRKSANATTPRNKGDMESQGFLALEPKNDDILYTRDMYGSGKEEDDHLATYSHSKSDCSKELIAELDKLRAQMLGEEAAKSPSKPSLDSGVYSGGIAFERHHCAVNINGSERSYQLASTVQIPKLMSAPGVQAKSSNSGVLDDDAKMRKNILKYGATLAMKGLYKHAPQEMLDRLKEQADITNLPSVGIEGNFAYPAWQLNIASATRRSNKIVLASSLGKFGRPHVDKGDSVAIPTSMTVLSKPHPDVPDEYFYLLDLGICWHMEEYSTLFFSGLHFHGGSQPCYSDTRTSTDLAECLTLIGYLPDMMIKGNNNVAFAALPQQKVLKVGLEMRNPISHRLSECLWTEQALYTADGSTIFEPISHLNNFSRSVTEVIASLCSQFPPNVLLRFDRDKLISCFSVVIDGKRTAPDPWVNDPGWSRADTAIGTDYTPILQSMGAESINDLDDKDLALLYNSDSLSQAPYGNTAIDRINNDWAAHTKRYASVIPICAVTDVDVPVIGGQNSWTTSRPAARGSAVKQARNGQVPIKKRKRPTSSRPKPSAKRPKTNANASALERGATSGEESTDCNDGDEASSNENDANPSIVDKSPFQRLLREITTNSLKGHLATAQSAQAGWVSIPSIQDTSESNFYIPDSTISSTARELWSIVNRHQTNHDTSVIGVWTQRQRLLMFNMALWEWLELSIETEYLAKNSMDEINGVRRLINDVEAFWVLDNADRVYDAARYLDGFTANSSVYCLKHCASNRKTIVTKSLVVSTTTDILVSWLGFPERELYQLQAWLTRQLLNAIGLDVLLLPEVWKALRSVRSHFLLARLNRMEDARSDIHNWALNHLPVYPILAEPECLGVLTQLCGLVYVQHPHGLNVESLARNSISSDTPPSVSTSPIIPDPALVLSQSPSFKSFYSSISLLYPFLDNPDFQITIPPLPPCRSTDKVLWNKYWTANYLSKVQMLADKRLPFRDHAPSRRRILAHGGPFSPENLSTRSGLFSALIYRGVTHNTTFLQEQSTMFRSLQDWEQLYLSLSASYDYPATYFCNRSAYGQCAAACSVDNVDAYWELSGHAGYLSWITSTTPISFVKLFELFLNIPAFGPVTALQLAVDYATAGKATCPSFAEMGHIIKRIDAGALKGLRSLGFSCNSEQSVALAFEQVYTALEQCIPQERKKQMQFNIFTVEHALCKLNRLVLSGFKNIET